MRMAWNLGTDRPIYIQLVEIIEMQIVSGYYPPGSKLPSVRELAAEAAVNPNTMQKAYAELERNGLIITQRTNGRNVTQDTALLEQVKTNIAGHHVADFSAKMKELGFHKKAAIDMVEQYFEEE